MLRVLGQIRDGLDCVDQCKRSLLTLDEHYWFHFRNNQVQSARLQHLAKNASKMYNMSDLCLKRDRPPLFDTHIVIPDTKQATGTRLQKVCH